MPELLRVTDDTTKADIAEALGHVLHRAKRQTPVVGTAEFPTPWDTAHEMLDSLLDDWLRAPERG